MKKIFSKVHKEELLACVIEKPQINNYRQDLSPVNEFLQVSARKFEKEISVAPHKHILNKRKIDRTQEPWIIVSGKVQIQLFDVDGINPILAEYSTEKSISIIIQKKNIVLGKSDLDITNDILKIVDKKIKTIKLN